MHLNRLRALVAVIEEGSFSSAARRLSLSQPAVSQQIKALEHDVAVTLVQRHTEPVQPTPAGRRLYARAKAILAEWERAEHELHALRERPHGRLTIGASTIPATYLLPRLIFRFREEYPRVDISVDVGSSDTVREAVLNGHVDVGAVGSHRPDRRLIERRLGEDELLLIVPCSHPWADGRRIPAEALLHEPVVTRAPGSGTRRTLEQALATWGIRSDDVNVALEVGSTEAAVAAVEAGLGITFVSRWAVEPALSLGRICTVSVDAPPIRREFFVIARRTRSHDPLVQALLAMVEPTDDGEVLPAGE